MLRIGLRRDLGATSAEVSTEPDLDGRLTCGLHFARQHMSDTNPDKLSDLANLGLDPASHPSLEGEIARAGRELRLVSEFLCTP